MRFEMKSLGEGLCRPENVHAYLAVLECVGLERILSCIRSYPFSELHDNLLHNPLPGFVQVQKRVVKKIDRKSVV